MKHFTTVPYHPQANGMLERFHGTLIPILRKCLRDKREWDLQVSLGMFAVRLTPNRAIGFSLNIRTNWPGQSMTSTKLNICIW